MDQFRRIKPAVSLLADLPGPRRDCLSLIDARSREWKRLKTSRVVIPESPGSGNAVKDFHSGNVRFRRFRIFPH
jgi:hypothetical protein